MIWVNRKAEYFSREGWTEKAAARPSGKSLDRIARADDKPRVKRHATSDDPPIASQEMPRSA
jgi:hypothetical protein